MAGEKGATVEAENECLGFELVPVAASSATIQGVKTASTIRRPNLKNRTRAHARCSGINTRRACVETTAKRTSKPTCVYDDRRRLESCSRDPIGFEGGTFNLYENLFGLSYTDSSGLRIDQSPRARCYRRAAATRDRLLRLIHEDLAYNLYLCAHEYYECTQGRPYEGYECGKCSEPIPDCILQAYRIYQFDMGRLRRGFPRVLRECDRLPG